VVPDLVCYLRIDVDTLALRVIESKGRKYWESGMDMRLGTDLYDSFKKYQGLITEEFDRMAEEFDFHVVDARRPPEEIQEDLRARILPILKGRGRRRVEKTPEKPGDKTEEGAAAKEPAAAP
jgi:dTMP kinase